MMNKIKYLVVLLLTLIACSGTNSRTNDDVGTISLNLLNVPSEVQCLRITATNSVRTVERDIPLTTSTGGTGGVSNIADETPLQGLPTGDVTVSANAYDVTCENIVSTTIPTWKSYPMEQIVEIVEGIPYAWELVLRPNGYVEPNVDWQGDEVVNEDVQNWLTTQNDGWCNNTYGKYINICGNVTYCTLTPPLGNYYNGFSVDIGFYWDGTDTGNLIHAGGDDSGQHRFVIDLQANTQTMTAWQPNANNLTAPIQQGKHLISYLNSSNGVFLYLDGILVASQTSSGYLSLVTTNEAGFVLGARMSELGSQDQWLKFVPFFFHLKNITTNWNFNSSITQQTSTIILLNNSTVVGNMWNSTVGTLNAYASGTSGWVSNFITTCQ